MIYPRRAKLQPMLRIYAVVLLVFWLLAAGFCSTECLCADDDSPAQPAHLKPAAATSGQSHDSDQHDDSFCLSLHSLSLQTAGPVLTQADFGLAFTPDFTARAQPPAPAPPATIISRQPPDGHRVFKPEVCLGPAFHSLAPPVLA